MKKTEVYLSGNKDSKILLVMPGLNDTGDPSQPMLNDATGKRLRGLFSFYGVDMSKFFAVCPACLGPDVADFAHCQPHRDEFRASLRATVERVQPKIIVTVGTQATDALSRAVDARLGPSDYKPMRLMNFAGYPVVMLMHPRTLTEALGAGDLRSFSIMSEFHRVGVSFALFRSLQAMKNELDLKTLDTLYKFVQDGVDAYKGRGLKKFEVVRTLAQANKLGDTIKRAGYYVHDYETTVLLPNDTGEASPDGNTYSKVRKVICLGFAVNGKGYVVPFDHGDPNAPHAEAGVHAVIKSVLEDESLNGVAHNAKFEYEVSNRWLGWRSPLSTMDTLLANFGRECKRGSNKLNVVAGFVGLKDFKDEAFGDKVDSTNLWNEPWEQVYTYNAFDCLVTEQIMLYFVSLFSFGDEGARLTKIIKILHKNLHVINGMAFKGARIDLNMFHRLYAENTAKKNKAWENLLTNPDVSKHTQELELTLAQKKWKSCAECTSFEEMLSVVAEKGLKNRPEFNFGSDTHMRWLMYDKLKYPIYAVTEAGKPSTADIAISRLSAEGYPIAKLLTEYREPTTMEDMFFKPTLDKVIYINGQPWVMPDWLQHGTETARLSNKDPNLQQYPTALKPIVLPDDDDSVIVDADESQIELRLLALFCEEKLHDLLNEMEPWVSRPGQPAKIHKQMAEKFRVMSQAYRRKLDLHRITAYRFYVDKNADILNIDPVVLMEKINKTQRKQGKRTNFGIGYGMGPDKYVRQSLAEGIPCTIEEAREQIDGVFKTFPAVPKAKRAFLQYCRVVLGGKTFTYFGTRRPMHELFSNEFKQRNGAEREAFNNPIQGGAGLMTQLCAYYFAEECKLRGRANPDWLRVRVFAIIHDSVVASCPKSIAKECADLLYWCLTNPASFVEMEDFGDFPFDSSVEVGYRWGKTVPVCGDDKPKELETWDVAGALAMAAEIDRKDTEQWNEKSKNACHSKTSQKPSPPKGKPKSKAPKKISLVGEQLVLKL